jgi:hypothetical protein
MLAIYIPTLLSFTILVPRFFRITVSDRRSSTGFFVRSMILSAILSLVTALLENSSLKALCWLDGNSQRGNYAEIALSINDGFIEEIIKFSLAFCVYKVSGRSLIFVSFCIGWYFGIFESIFAVIHPGIKNFAYYFMSECTFRPVFHASLPVIASFIVCKKPYNSLITLTVSLFLVSSIHSAEDMLIYFGCQYYFYCSLMELMVFLSVVVALILICEESIVSERFWRVLVLASFLVPTAMFIMCGYNTGDYVFLIHIFCVPLALVFIYIKNLLGNRFIIRSIYYRIIGLV